MLLLPNEEKQKFSFEAKVVLAAFAVVFAAMLSRSWGQMEVLVRFQAEGHGAREVLQNLNRKYVEKEGKIARIHAEKAKADVRTIASVTPEEQKPQE